MSYAAFHLTICVRSAGTLAIFATRDRTTGRKASSSGGSLPTVRLSNMQTLPPTISGIVWRSFAKMKNIKFGYFDINTLSMMIRNANKIVR